MSVQAYRTIKLQPSTLRIIEQANEFIEELDGQRMTLRQIYYRFIGTDSFPESWKDVAYNLKHGLDPKTWNTIKNYKRLGGILADGRYAGLIDWEAIEDRVREADVPSEWDSIGAVADSAIRAFRLPRWNGQRNYVELCVEKDALAGVLEPFARKWHVPLMVNKGYGSSSAMKEAADRIINAIGARVVFGCAECMYHEYEHDHEERKICQECQAPWDPRAYGQDGERDPVILYLGDHDPSGEDMVRDVKERLQEFGVPRLRMRKFGLTMAQIKQFKLPPNPAKVTDSRAAAYIEKFGDKSWEVDALPPRELNRLVDDEIRALVDVPKYEAMVAEENRQRELLKKAVSKISRKAGG